MTNNTLIYGATGQYVNDDGVTVDQNGTYNQYTMQFTYRDQINNISNDESIRLTFGVKQLASKFYNNETKCAMVNQNDLLGSIYIYDEVGLFQHTNGTNNNYFVELLRPDQTFEELGLAKFDLVTKRLVYNYTMAV